MALKSHKVRQQDESATLIAAERRRHTSLSDLERRVQYKRRGRKRSGGSVLKGIGKAIQSLNKSTAEQARRMPSDKDVNKWMWG